MPRGSGASDLVLTHSVPESLDPPPSRTGSNLDCTINPGPGHIVDSPQEQAFIGHYHHGTWSYNGHCTFTHSLPTQELRPCSRWTLTAQTRHGVPCPGSWRVAALTSLFASCITTRCVREFSANGAANHSACQWVLRCPGHCPKHGHEVRPV